MKYLLTLFILAGTFNSTFAQESFAIPTDETTPVFVFDRYAGLRELPASDSESVPFLQVFPNGRVLKSTNGPQPSTREFQLTETQLTEFLEKVVNEHRFYDLNVEKIKAELDATGKPFAIADLPQGNFEMLLGRGEHQFGIRGANSLARQFPENESLQDAVAIEKLALQLAMVATSLPRTKLLEPAHRSRSV